MTFCFMIDSLLSSSVARFLMAHATCSFTASPCSASAKASSLAAHSAWHFANSACRVFDEERADWFYVPAYFTCAYVGIQGRFERENGSDWARIMEETGLHMDIVFDKEFGRPFFTWLLKKNKYFCPTINVDNLWSLVGEDVRKEYASKSEAPVMPGFKKNN